MNRIRQLALLPLLCALGCQGIPVYYDIGAIHREVSTASPEAQLWFDRGLALAFGFNHEEAARCFDRAQKADPQCAMAAWGKAYACGPNYNKVAVTNQDNAAALTALATAEQATHCSEVERALIDALRTRHHASNPTDRTSLDLAYANAMLSVHERCPDDPDVAALTAEALMMLQPWKLWDPTGRQAPITAQIRAVLEPALQRWPDHAALCHLYIHTMEAGPEVGRALPAAATLERLAPGLGHLVHMPSHVYAWTGRYRDVIRVNQAAVAADLSYANCKGRANFYTLYRLHNYHFIAYGAMFDGQRAVALRAARAIEHEIPPELLDEMIDDLDIFFATPYHVMVRFGMWEEVLAEPKPDARLLATTAVWHYARGVALAVLGRVAAADAERSMFARAARAVPRSRLLFNNPVHEILAVAEKVLAGEFAYRAGDPDRAFALLREAVALDLALNYDEPWGWMEPARHALGALLTEQGRYEEAITVYRANLSRYPENGWALHGLAECLRRTGDDVGAREAQARFSKAWERSDVRIPGSCFCKTR